MLVQTLDSQIAHQNWPDLLDCAMTGETDVVVTRAGKPLIAMISYQDYADLQEELDELRAARRAFAIYQEWKRDPSIAQPWEEVMAELAAEGLIDE